VARGKDINNNHGQHQKYSTIIAAHGSYTFENATFVVSILITFFLYFIQYYGGGWGGILII
jgi:hypothetical protein